jgi:hypothetical protein
MYFFHVYSVSLLNVTPRKGHSLVSCYIIMNKSDIAITGLYVKAFHHWLILPFISYSIDQLCNQDFILNDLEKQISFQIIIDLCFILLKGICHENIFCLAQASLRLPIFVVFLAGISCGPILNQLLSIIG